MEWRVNLHPQFSSTSLDTVLLPSKPNHFKRCKILHVPWALRGTKCNLPRWTLLDSNCPIKVSKKWRIISILTNSWIYIRRGIRWDCLSHKVQGILVCRTLYRKEVLPTSRARKDKVTDCFSGLTRIQTRLLMSSQKSYVKKVKSLIW